jgi:hypothetical protein
MKDFSKGIFNEQITLILGAPRSGTTLLAAMISSHEEATILMEDYYGGVFRILSKQRPGVKLCMPNQIELEEGRFTIKLRKLANIGLSQLNVILGHIKLKPLNPFIIRSTYSIRDYINTADKIHIISILRSPVEATKSETKRGGLDSSASKRQWLRALEILDELHQERESFESFTLIDFYQLVTEPENTIRKVFSNQKLTFSAASLDGFKHTPQYQAQTKINPNKAKTATANSEVEFFEGLGQHHEIYLRLKKAANDT